MFKETETITFTREYNLESGRLSCVEMREPTTRDIREAVQASAKHAGDPQMRDSFVEQFLIIKLTDLTPNDVDSLAFCDYERLQIGLLIVRADPANREGLRKANAMGENAPSDSNPATSEGSTNSPVPEAVTPISALP